jgi:pre-mRNA-splicing helicase BRR2
VKDIADFQNMEDEDRESILSSFSSEQIEEIANATNRYPSINISNSVENEEEIHEGS